MSVVAGCSLLNGVLIGADCRVTLSRRGQPDVYTDTCQKLFAIADTTVLGFVGNLRPASHLLTAMIAQLPNRRDDGWSILRWLPRFFKHEYKKVHPAEPVAFMAASCLVDRLNIVERDAVVRLMQRFIEKKRTWGPAILAQLLMVSRQYKRIAIPDTSYGLLYTMHAPDFRPRLHRPLQFVAIGSGKSLEEEIGQKQDMIFASHPGNYHMEGFWFHNAIERFISHKNMINVGGLFPMMKVDGSGVLCLGQGAQTTPSGLHIDLTYSDDGWIQKNHVTGKEIRLVEPWKVDTALPLSLKFDDFRRGPFG